MLSKIGWYVVMSALCLCLILAGAACSRQGDEPGEKENEISEQQEPQEKDEEGEIKVEIAELPPAVQATVRLQSEGATIAGIVRESKDDKVFYELELKVDGRTRDITIDADGVIVTVEEEIAIETIPPAVRATIEKEAGKGTVTLVETVTEGGVLKYYEAHVQDGDKEFEVKVTPDGNVLKEEGTAR